MKRNVVAVVFIGGLLAGCALKPDTPPAPEPTKAVSFTVTPKPALGSMEVTREMFGAEEWPLTVGKGELACQAPSPELTIVTFTVTDIDTKKRTVYAVNGVAKNRAKSEGWRDISEIWADNRTNPETHGPKKNIGPLVDRGLKLCQ